MVSLIICFELDAVNNLLSMLSNSLLRPFALLLALSTPVLHSRLLQYLAQVLALFRALAYTVTFLNARLHWVSYHKKNMPTTFLS